MARYIKKPVEVDAIRYAGLDYDGEHHAISFDGDEYPDWIAEAIAKARPETGAVWVEKILAPRVQIRTQVGVQSLSPGDWIIRGVQGELYPSQPDRFAATYDPA